MLLHKIYRSLRSVLLIFLFFFVFSYYVSLRFGFSVVISACKRWLVRLCACTKYFLEYAVNFLLDCVHHMRCILYQTFKLIGTNPVHLKRVSSAENSSATLLFKQVCNGVERPKFKKMVSSECFLGVSILQLLIIYRINY